MKPLPNRPVPATRVCHFGVETGYAEFNQQAAEMNPCESKGRRSPVDKFQPLFAGCGAYVPRVDNSHSYFQTSALRPPFALLGRELCL